MMKKWDPTSYERCNQISALMMNVLTSVQCTCTDYLATVPHLATMLVNLARHHSWAFSASSADDASEPWEFFAQQPQHLVSFRFHASTQNIKYTKHMTAAGYSCYFHAFLLPPTKWLSYRVQSHLSVCLFVILLAFDSPDRESPFLVNLQGIQVKFLYKVTGSWSRSQ